MWLAVTVLDSVGQRQTIVEAKHVVEFSLGECVMKMAGALRNMFLCG